DRGRRRRRRLVDHVLLQVPWTRAGQVLREAPEGEAQQRGGDRHVERPADLEAAVHVARRQQAADDHAGDDGAKRSAAHQFRAVAHPTLVRRSSRRRTRAPVTRRTASQVAMSAPRPAPPASRNSTKIWYFAASNGAMPARIWPVIIPG